MFISLSIIYVLPINNYLTNEVTFINVGQGDSCLIRNQNTTILIDTGGSVYKDIAKDCLIPFFKKKRIYKLDYIFITHDDYDHSGALNSLIENFNVSHVIKERSSFPIKIKDITFTNLNTYVTEDENDSSLVLSFNFMDIDFLMMGDASIKIENHIMESYSFLECDVLKIGHHGSNTSTSKEFIDYVSPKEAIISVGRNYYGHPAKSVIEILLESGIKIKRTDILGSITYSNYIFM